MNFIKNNPQRLVVSLICLLLIFFSSYKIFDDYGMRYTDEGFERSLLAFAIGKGLNGAISIVQGTEVALEPAGVGVVLTPGQILDPANDLIERFSMVMLVCSIALGIQSVLLSIFSSSVFLVAVAIPLLLISLLIWREPSSVILKNTLLRVSVFFLILRFFIPLMAVTSDGLYKAFLKPMYETSTQQLEYSDKTITRISEENNKTDDGENLSWYALMTKNVESAIDAFDVNQRVQKLKMEVEKLTNSVIDLIVVFTLQTILFPLMFIWLSLKLIKANFSFKYFSSKE